MKNKKKFLNNKSLIILGILFIAILLLYFVFFKNQNTKLMRCTMSIENFAYANLEIEIDAHYTNEIEKLEGKIYMDIHDEALKSKVTELEERLKEYYANSIKNTAINVNVTSEDFTITLDYSIDYNQVEVGDIENFDLFPIEENKEKVTIAELKEQIHKTGGSCIEE